MRLIRYRGGERKQIRIHNANGIFPFFIDFDSAELHPYNLGSVIECPLYNSSSLFRDNNISVL